MKNDESTTVVPGVESHLDNDRLFHRADQNRQMAEEHAMMRNIWREVVDETGKLVLVGFGSRWYAYDCDAELLAELALSHPDKFKHNGEHHPVASMPVEQEWLGPLLADGYQVQLVLVRYRNGRIERVEVE